MSLTKYKVSAKGKKSGKWWGYFYATSFDNGGMSIKFNKKQLEKLLEDIKECQLEYDQYGYISMNMYEDKPIDESTKQHYKDKSNGYVKQEKEIEIEDLNTIPF